MTFSTMDQPPELESTKNAPKILSKAIQDMNHPLPEKNYENLQISDREVTKNFAHDNFADNEEDFASNDDGPGNWENENDDNFTQIVDEEIQKAKNRARLKPRTCRKCGIEFQPEESKHKLCPDCAPGRQLKEDEKLNGENTKNCIRCNLLFMPERTDHKLCADCGRNKFYWRQEDGPDPWTFTNPNQNN